MHLGAIYQYLLIAPHALLLAVCVALVRHKLYRQFPFFFAYIVEEIIQASVLIFLIEWPGTSISEYTLLYSVGYVLSTILRFGVVYEIFTHIFRKYADIEKLGKSVLRWAAVALALIALGLAALRGVDTSHLLLVEHLFDRTTSILQCGLMMTLFVFSSQLGLSWRSHVFGIALGIGVTASADLVASAIRMETGLTHQIALNYFVMAAYHVCVLIWIFYLFAPEKSYAANELPQHDLETWNVELERMLKQP